MDRELVITIPLREEPNPAAAAAGSPRHRRHLVDLGPRLRAFRAAHGLTQAEVARVVGATTPATVTQWEAGVTVPDGMRRERLRALLAGELSHELRVAMIAGAGLPGPWERAVRWYRRASRERRARETIGRLIAGVLNDLRGVAEVVALRRRFEKDHAGGVSHSIAKQASIDLRGRDLRRVEDATYGLRWLELAHDVCFDLDRSLVGQLPLSWVDEAT